MVALIPEEAKCIDCNYALRGLTDFRCPECGRPFDPERHLSMNLGRPLGPLPRAILRPMGRLPRIIVWSLVATGVVGPAWLIPDEQLACLWLLLWGGFFAACWGRSTVRALVVRLYRQPRILLRLDETGGGGGVGRRLRRRDDRHDGNRTHAHGNVDAADAEGTPATSVRVTIVAPRPFSPYRS
jgi:hypothetical protein